MYDCLNDDETNIDITLLRKRVEVTMASTKTVLVIIAMFLFLTGQILLYRKAKETNSVISKLGSFIGRCNSTSIDKYLFDWKALMNPCKSAMSWLNESSIEAKDKFGTKANMTKIIYRMINREGQCSTVIVQTYSSNGNPKSIGGDSWRAVLRGKVVHFAFVFDRMDGSYEVHFCPFESGTYSLELTLEFSLCDGVRDPPRGWFEKGDIHGHFQEQGALGVSSSFVLDPAVALLIEIPSAVDIAALPKKRPTESLGLGCHHFTDLNIPQCNIIYDKFGYWYGFKKKYKWASGRVFNQSEKSLSFRRYNKLWIYGDSLGHRWWNSVSGQMLCNKLFNLCTHTFTYTYEFKKYDYTKVNIGKGFNETRFFAPIHSIFNDSEMNNRSVLVINFGLHLIMSLNFSQCQKVIDRFAQIVRDLKTKRNPASVPLIIWKTTTFAPLEQGKFRTKSHSRFLTNPRIRLFNAYTNMRLCSEEIPIFDVYPVTASYPLGSIDGLHYHEHVSSPAEEALKDFLVINAG